MRFGISLLAAPLIFFCDRANAQSLLQQRFAINGPVYTYDSLKFVMDFEVSDFMKDSMVGFSLYDGLNCKDGGDNDITENDGYLLSRIRTDNTPIGDGSGIRAVKVDSEIVPTGIVESGLYRTDDDGNGIIEYCLRFAVYNMDKDDPQAFEANFLEIPVKLVLTLNGGFSVSANLSNIDTILATAKEDAAVEAYICDNEDNIIPIMPTEQGQSVRVCVSPTPQMLAVGALMRQLEKFTFRREIPASTKQVAINPGTNGVPADQLTVVSCQPGSTVCAFETLLKADFFVSEGVVAGQGEAFLQLGVDDSVPARRLQGGPNQKLSEEPTAYSISINLVPLEKMVGMDELMSSAPAMATTLFGTFLVALTFTIVEGFL